MTQAPAQPVEATDSPRDGAALKPGPPQPAPPTRVTRIRYSTLVGSHLIVDLYPIFLVSLAVSLQSNLALSDAQRALIIALGPIVSGVCQPLFAWIGDRFNTRLFGPLGLAVGAVCISSIGFAQTFGQLLALQTIGLIGTGIYHPVGAALAGRLGVGALKKARFVRSPRTTGLAIFFLAGMLGGTIGPILSTRLNEATGDLRWLAVMALPGLLFAVLLWLAARRVEHREIPTFAQEDTPEAARTLRLRRRCVGVLFVSNALRYTANVGLYFLFTAWAKAQFLDDKVASSRAGDLVAATTLGMAVGAIAPMFTPKGDERRTLLRTGLLAAPCVALIPFVPLPVMMVCTGLAAAFYFTGVPTAVALAHRLMPHATGMTGSLLMGLGWVVAASGPFLGERIIEASDRGLTIAFLVMAAALALSGLVNLLLDEPLVRRTAGDD